MNAYQKLAVIGTASVLTACATPTMEQSKGSLWARFSNHPLEDVMVAWGAPAHETQLADGAKIITYARAHAGADNASLTNDFSESSSECNATFIAPAPYYRIAQINLVGDTSECADMVIGSTGPASSRPYTY